MLKSCGWVVVVVGWPKILVSAPVPLELIGIGFDWVGAGPWKFGFGDGLDNCQAQVQFKHCLASHTLSIYIPGIFVSCVKKSLVLTINVCFHTNDMQVILCCEGRRRVNILVEQDSQMSWHTSHQLLSTQRRGYDTQRS